MCVAPGCFLSTAIDLNLGVEVAGFSVPTSDGGYYVLLPREKQECISFLDITMLAADMGVAASFVKSGVMGYDEYSEDIQRILVSKAAQTKGRP